MTSLRTAWPVIAPRTDHGVPRAHQQIQSWHGRDVLEQAEAQTQSPCRLTALYFALCPEQYERAVALESSDESFVGRSPPSVESAL